MGGGRFKQIESESGSVWKEPPGPDVADLEGEEFEDSQWIEFDDGLELLEAALEQSGVKIPWQDSDELDVTAVQKLASQLKVLDWEAAKSKGAHLTEFEESAAKRWEKFRAFVIDAARSCNGIVCDLDDW